MSCSNHCSFLSNRSHFKVGGPKLSRGAHLDSTFKIGLINYSWLEAPRVTDMWIFFMDAKISCNLTCWPSFKWIGQELMKLFTFLVLAQIIKSIIPKFIVLDYFRNRCIWEPMLLDFKITHLYLQTSQVSTKSDDPHVSIFLILTCIGSRY